MAYPQSMHTLPSPSLSQRSHRSERSHSQKSSYSRSSMRSSTNGIPDMETRGLEAATILDQLKKEIVYLTGGRDRQGGPLLLFPPHRDMYFLPNDITACLKYLSQIPSDESKRRGFTVVIDSRDGSWSNLVTVLGCLKQSLGDYLKQVLVLRVDGQGQKQPSSSSFRRERGPNLEPQFVNLNRLYTTVDRNQLVGSMGGTLMYHHQNWLQNRLDLEKFVREARAASSHMDTSESEIGYQIRNQGPESPISPQEALQRHRYFQDSIVSVPRQVLWQGKELLGKLQHYSDVAMRGEQSVTTLDNLEAQKQVKRMLQYLENRVDKVSAYLENRDRMLNLDVQRDSVQREIRQVVDWILGPGEKLLASQYDIGDSYETAENLRKRHEELEIKCTDTYGHYAELRHRAEDLFDEPSPYTNDIRAQRDYMDTVCRSFASRLERRRTLLITSVRFQRLTEEFSRKLDDLLEMLYNDKEADTVEAAQEALTQLQEKVDAIDSSANRAMQDGHSLLDEMSRPVKNAFGKDISPDYAHQLKHVNQKLEELQERKMRCDELAEVRKLKLQQMLQLRTCENDAEQAIAWILELCERMMTTTTHIGQTQQEIDSLQEEHKRVENAAEGTYDYGKQLLQAGLVLRRLLRLELEPNTILVHRLEEAWKRFFSGNNERANRLNVASMFLVQSEKLLEEVEQLMVVVAQTLTGDIHVPDALRQHTPDKVKVEAEVKDTSRMGQALLERLALPIIVVDGHEKKLSTEDQSAMETINNRLRKMDHKLSELNRYWNEMQQTGQPPSVHPKISKSFQPYSQDQGQQGQRSATLPARTPSDRRSLNLRPLGPGRSSSFHSPEERKRIRNGPIKKHDSIRGQERRSKSGDKPDRKVTNGHERVPSQDQIQPETYNSQQSRPHVSQIVQPETFNSQQSRPHVSQSYYPKSEEFSRHMPSYSYQAEPPEQPMVEEQQVHPNVYQNAQSAYDPGAYPYHTQSQMNISQSHPPDSNSNLAKSQSQPSALNEPPASKSVSKYSYSQYIPDTLPVSKSMPNATRELPPKVDINSDRTKHISRRGDSPPLSFQQLRTKFETEEHEAPVESQEKRDVQKELSAVLKSRANFTGEEPDEPDAAQLETREGPKSDLEAELEQVRLVLT